MSSVDAERERFRRASAILARAAEVDEPERSKLVERACGSDHELLTEVRSLLEHMIAGGDSRLDPPRVQQELLSIVDQQDPPLPPTIGRFRPLRLIASGGMGRVYECEQDKPRRRVAVKVMRGVVAGGEGRFQREVELLGRLQHPGIVQLYEAGIATLNSERLPYFAMELVEGDELLVAAKARELDTRRRVELLARIAEIVAHAHERGIVHRDLKPANILVTADGDAKVLDFGVGRLLTGAAGETLQTATGQLVGTLAYMSPEQVRGRTDAVDARSDVYALGVLAYQLLSGRLPLEITGIMVPEAVRSICEDEPDSLSRVDRRLRGDLDTIVTKAMAKEPDRRYATAAALAADLRRYLADEPIVARAPSSLYQLSKFARRNRALVGGIAIAFLALLTGTLLSLRAASDARQANAEALEAERIAEVRAAIASRAEKDANWSAYRFAISAAASAIARNDVPLTAEILEDTPRQLRGWEWRHLTSKLHESLATLRCGVNEHVVGVDDDGVLLVDLKAASIRKLTLTGDELWLESLAARPIRIDSRALGAAMTNTVLRANEREIVYVDRENDTELARFSCPQLPAGRTVVRTVSDDRCWARLWYGDRISGLCKICDGTVLNEIQRMRSFTTSQMAFSPDSTRFVQVDLSARAVVRSVADGTVVAEFPCLDPIKGVVWTGGGNTLTTVEDSGRVQTWDIESGRVTRTGPTIGGRPIVVASTPDDRWLAIGARDGTVSVLNEVPEVSRVLQAHGNAVSDLVFAADGRTFASGSRLDRSVRIWPTEEARTLVLRGHRQIVRAVALSGDGSQIASGSSDGRVRLWRTAIGTAVRTHVIGPSRECQIYDLTYQAGGDVDELVVASTCGLLRIDADSGAVLSQGASHSLVPVGSIESYPPSCEILSATGREIWRVDGQTLAVVGKLAGRHPLARSADGLRLATATSDGLAVWDTDTWELAASYPMPSGAVVRSVAWLPGRRVLIGRADGVVDVIDIERRALVATLEGHVGPVNALAPTPDGERVASGDDDGTILLWDTGRWSDVLRLADHREAIASLAWSGDGTTLVSASGDRTVRIWPSRQRD